MSGICLSISSMRCAALELDVVRRREPAAGAGGHSEDDREDDRATHRRNEPEHEERERDRAEALIAEDLPRRRAVHARRDELLADLLLAEPARAARRPVAEPSGDRVDRAARGGLGLRAARRLRDVAVRLDLVDRRRRAACALPRSTTRIMMPAPRSSTPATAISPMPMSHVQLRDLLDPERADQDHDASDDERDLADERVEHRLEVVAAGEDERERARRSAARSGSSARSCACAVSTSTRRRSSMRPRMTSATRSSTSAVLPPASRCKPHDERDLLGVVALHAARHDHERVVERDAELLVLEDTAELGLRRLDRAVDHDQSAPIVEWPVRIAPASTSRLSASCSSNALRIFETGETR